MSTSSHFLGPDGNDQERKEICSATMWDIRSVSDVRTLEVKLRCKLEGEDLLNADVEKT